MAAALASLGQNIALGATDPHTNRPKGCLLLFGLSRGGGGRLRGGNKYSQYVRAAMSICCDPIASHFVAVRNILDRRPVITTNIRALSGPSTQNLGDKYLGTYLRPIPRRCIALPSVRSATTSLPSTHSWSVIVCAMHQTLVLFLRYRSLHHRSIGYVYPLGLLTLSYVCDTKTSKTQQNIISKEGESGMSAQVSTSIS
ncbi:hypothetical protein BC628DRAFT_776983 [Trametes gibbosa]|nr:hypothetical protein BC628DRAFT_776983 [Trametes gibbosa]